MGNAHKSKGPNGSKKKGTWSVSPVPLVPILSVSSGLASSVVMPGTSRRPVPRSDCTVTSWDRSPGVIIQSELTGSVQVSDVAMLDSLKGGVVTEYDQGLAVLFESDSDIESRLTGTLRAYLPAWRCIEAGAFALSVIANTFLNWGLCPLFMLSLTTKAIGIMLLLRMML